MSGEVYYVPGIKNQTNGVLVTPKNMSNTKNGYQTMGVATFPQTGNASSVWMQILGVIIGIMTFGVIDINRNRHQTK
ncbi:hypothetical protein FD29_GL001595 [Companilactobacillus mindensis DSM 14500]|uniref:Gram-positive cocci surface proteins LPxTG domain-containing protein n=1 Tax=Companilactobacillus mindensis DSM 14500 TaxID=1423770 RepID=A0A0R1QKT7_9LACO|nr:LPXTG cell wall anchor domain-containing protein [Companilactobacillus mindensis]KRL42725.1 hypothetical protein FD29_GL001595 [Companilactobacillus mindensis DSM 14500]GEO78493.1 hypothetical protein LMI01_08240 [Companilactobacillus mindensis]